MTRKEIISMLLTDAAQGDPIPLMHYIDYLLVKKHIPLSRLITIAERSFGIPPNLSMNTFQYFV